MDVAINIISQNVKCERACVRASVRVCVRARVCVSVCFSRRKRELADFPIVDGYTISFLSPGTMVRQSLYCSFIQIFSGHITVLFCI